MDHARPDNPLADLTEQRVLIVDDDDDCRELLATLLEGRNAQVICASSADEGLTQVVAERPTVIVSDIGMPGEDGYSFMRRLRALPRDLGGALPSIALTAFNLPRDRAEALAAGFSSYLCKPIDFGQLCQQIRALGGGLAF
ncbi:MAG TPA: response regulator [Polyangiales bacterium]